MKERNSLPRLPSPLGEMAREKRLPHSINLEGEPGSGRTALAMALAGAVLCEKQQGEMCRECSACRKVLAGVHSDVLLVEDLPTKDQVGLVRELRKNAYTGPHEGRAKVIIIPDAKRLSRESQNVLLKVIEEPPEDTFFIFTCDNKFRLLPTILSRVTTISLHPLAVEDCARLLGERFPQKSPEECREAALLACGAPGEGEAILTNAGAAKRARAARAVVESMARGDAYHTIAAAVPYEKTRQEYGLLLEAALRLSMLPELRGELGISPGEAAALRQRLQRAEERNRQNGCIPLLTSLLTKKN